jgi:TolB-like protein
VLPFTNLGNNPDQQYFADALTEDLTVDMSRLAHMFVISSSTAFTFKGKPIDTKRIGRELGVRYVLEGSVKRSGDQARVNAQLINAETDAHLWAERFDRVATDLFSLEDEITRRIAAALDAQLIAAEAARPTERPDALDYILRGRAAQPGPATSEARAEAIGLFERALALDPDSIEARIRLAEALANRALVGMSGSHASDISLAEMLIGQALEASPSDSHAHLVKASVRRAQGRCAEAVPEYEAVIASDGNRASAYAGLGTCKLLTGSIDETIPLEQEAVRLSPRDSYVGIRYFRIGVTHLLQSRTDEAIVWLEKAAVTLPGYPIHHAWLAAALALKGENNRAAAELAEARRLKEGSYSSIVRLRILVPYRGSVPKIQALFEATYFVGLRKAGMPEE